MGLEAAEGGRREGEVEGALASSGGRKVRLWTRVRTEEEIED